MKKMIASFSLLLLLTGCTTSKSYTYVGQSNDATLTLISSSKRMPIDFSVSIDTNNYNYVGQVFDYDKSSADMLDSFAFMLATDHPQLEIKIPYGKPIGVSAYFYRNTQTPSELIMESCGPVVGRFIAQAQGHYLATFYADNAAGKSSCRMAIHDITNPAAPVSLYP